MYGTEQLKVRCVCCRMKNGGKAVGDIALQRNYEYSAADIYVLYFTGNSLGELSDKY
jgi:hypothetical protein